MATPRTLLRLVLIQVRSHPTSLRQEQSAFIEHCGVAPQQMRFVNVVEEPAIAWSDVADAHAVLIGGAGAYSVTHRHPFTEPLTELVLELIERGRPVFGVCWGHQFLAAVTGGAVITDGDQSEVGTFGVTLTAEGFADPLFADTRSPFWAQLGHNDSAVALGPGWRELARSERCRFQAIRLDGRPVYGTQFHCELDERRLRERLLVYLDDYVKDDDEHQRILRGLRPSVDADRLLSRFLELYA
jgi:GMP synthase (glutamine-hydrolysing)